MDREIASFGAPATAAAGAAAVPLVSTPSLNQAPQPALAAMQPLTVLLADDEPVVRYVIAQMLTRLGHRVVLACDGQEALAAYRSNQDSIDLVIFDLTMPNVTGVEMFREIKLLNPGIRALLTTGNYEDESIEDMRDGGLTGFLAKPFDIYDLERELTRILTA